MSNDKGTVEPAQWNEKVVALANAIEISAMLTSDPQTLVSAMMLVLVRGHSVPAAREFIRGAIDYAVNLMREREEREGKPACHN